MAKLFLVDGHSLVYRSHFAFQRKPLATSTGRPTSAVFGFVTTLRKLLDTFQPTHAAVVFDAPGKTFRHEEFAEYKASRPETPDEIREQLPLVKEFVQALGIAAFEKPGVEADDVLGSLARRFERDGWEVVIVSSDKDLWQLVDERVSVYDAYKEQTVGPAAVRDRFGVRPDQVPDILALAGDAIDDIPGVPGIGEKRAIDIITRYGSVERAAAEEPRVRTHQDVALLSKRLAVVEAGLELGIGAEALARAAPDTVRLLALFRELEFDSLAREFTAPVALAVAVQSLDPAALAAAPVLAVARDPAGDLLLTADGATVHHDPACTAAPLLASPATLKVGYDLKTVFRARPDVGLAPPFFDVQVAAWLIDPNRKRYGLDDLMLEWGGARVEPRTPAEVCAASWRLLAPLRAALDRHDLSTLFADLEMPLVPVLAAIERRGVAVDPDYLARVLAEFAAERTEIEAEIYRQVGHSFNLASPKQLAVVLFEELKLPHRRRTKTGFSTDAAAIRDLAARHPVAELILRQRELAKLIATYLEPLRAAVDPATGRVHARFHQTGTATGRLSSSDPNLQNIPVRSEWGRKVRRAFVAAPGSVIVAADYSQIEMRVLAHIADEPVLQADLAAGADIHDRTARVFFGPEPPDRAQARRIAKAVNYGIVYGISAYGLAAGLGISPAEAQVFIDDYFHAYPRVAAWRQATIESARERGEVRPRFGRGPALPALARAPRRGRESGERLAVNSVIQGTAADIMKRAMLLVEERLARSGLAGGMIAQVHDELVLEVAAGRADAAAELVRGALEDAAALTVPLAASVAVGANWDQAHV